MRWPGQGDDAECRFQTLCLHTLRHRPAVGDAKLIPRKRGNAPWIDSAAVFKTIRASNAAFRTNSNALRCTLIGPRFCNHVGEARRTVPNIRRHQPRTRLHLVNRVHVETTPRCPFTANCCAKFAAPLASVIVPAASSNSLLKARSFSGKLDTSSLERCSPPLLCEPPDSPPDKIRTIWFGAASSREADSATPALIITEVAAFHELSVALSEAGAFALATPTRVTRSAYVPAAISAKAESPLAEAFAYIPGCPMLSAIRWQRQQPHAPTRRAIRPATMLSARSESAELW